MRYGTALLVCLSLAACDAPQAPGVPEKTFLDAIGFNQPIELSIDSRRLYDSENRFRSDENALLVALAAKAGYVRIVPSLEHWPWWGFAPVDGTFSDGVLPMRVGTRIVTRRSEERTWQEGPNRYYAETIAYSVVPSDRLRPVVSGALPQRPFRLIAVNDPAVGHWQVLVGPERTPFDPKDTAALAEQLAGIGGTYADDLSASIGTAQQGAFETIERQLLASRTLARSNNYADLILSPAHNLVFYAKSIALTQPLSEVQSYCRSLQFPGFARFRIPSQSDMGAVIDSKTGRFIDTPDGRFWGPTGINQPDPRATVFFAVNTFTIGFGNQPLELDLDTLSGVLPYSYYYNMQTYRIEPNGLMARTYVPYDVAGNHPIAAHDYPNARWRVLCVGDVVE